MGQKEVLYQIPVLGNDHVCPMEGVSYMAKTIKFNLICDNQPVRTLEDLREHFCVQDILLSYRSGFRKLSRSRLRVKMRLVPTQENG